MAAQLWLILMMSLMPERTEEYRRVASCTQPRVLVRVQSPQLRSDDGSSWVVKITHSKTHCQTVPINESVIRHFNPNIKNNIFAYQQAFPSRQGWLILTLLALTAPSGQEKFCISADSDLPSLDVETRIPLSSIPRTSLDD